MSIEELKRAGYTVKVSHRRPTVGIPETFKDYDAIENRKGFCRTKYTYKRDGGTMEHVDRNGGYTTVSIIGEDGTLRAYGESICRPDESFNKKLGLQIALGRAVKALVE